MVPQEDVSKDSVALNLDGVALVLPIVTLVCHNVILINLWYVR